MIYHFLPERMKIENVEELVANFHDKKEYVTQKKFKTSIKCGLVMKKQHRVNKSKQET